MTDDEVKSEAEKGKWAGIAGVGFIVVLIWAFTFAEVKAREQKLARDKALHEWCLAHGGFQYELGDGCLLPNGDHHE